MFFDQGKKVKNSSIKGLLVQIKYIKKTCKMLIQQFGNDLQFQQPHSPSVKEINAANLQVIFIHN